MWATGCICRKDFLADSQSLWQKRKAHEAEVRQRRIQYQNDKYQHQLHAAGKESVCYDFDSNAAVFADLRSNDLGLDYFLLTTCWSSELNVVWVSCF